MSKSLEIFTDGACSGNPGPAGIGVVIKDGKKIVKKISRAIGPSTNNVAEYTALIYGLQEALILRAQRVSVTTDSELMYHQIRGSYKVKEPSIRFLFDLCQHLIQGFKGFEIRHVLREHNKEADKLATQSIKEQAQMVAPLFDSGEESPSSKG